MKLLLISVLAAIVIAVALADESVAAAAAGQPLRPEHRQLGKRANPITASLKSALRNVRAKTRAALSKLPTFQKHIRSRQASASNAISNSLNNFRQNLRNTANRLPSASGIRQSLGIRPVRVEVTNPLNTTRLPTPKLPKLADPRQRFRQIMGDVRTRFSNLRTNFVTNFNRFTPNFRPEVIRPPAGQSLRFNNPLSLPTVQPNVIIVNVPTSGSSGAAPRRRRPVGGAGGRRKKSLGRAPRILYTDPKSINGYEEFTLDDVVRPEFEARKDVEDEVAFVDTDKKIKDEATTIEQLASTVAAKQPTDFELRR